MSETVRAFIAIELPPEVKEALGRMVAPLRQGRVTGVRWVEPDGMHLTLKFLGDVVRSQLERVAQAMEQAAMQSRPFGLELSGVGAFPSPKAPRVLWVGLIGEVEAIASLQRALEEALAPLGFPREGRPFTPHLTLGRVRDQVLPSERGRIGQAFSGVAAPQGLRFQVEALSLMQSTLRPEGALYTRLHHQPLGQAQP